MTKVPIQRPATHPPINRRKRKSVWDLFSRRDANEDGEILCGICGQPEFQDPEFKMEIGHLNVPTPKYVELYQSNSEINLFPNHSRCNQLLKGKDFFKKCTPKLIEILEKNIKFSKSKTAFNKEWAAKNTVSEDPSTIQNKKSIIYDRISYQFLDLNIPDLKTNLEFDSVVDDVVGLVHQLHGFGSPEPVKRHLKKLCNKYNLEFMMDTNEHGIDIIRRMRSDEVKFFRKQLSLYKPNTNC